MAQKMDQGRLLKIGYEASALLEEFDARKGRPNNTLAAMQRPAVARQGSKLACVHQHEPQKPLVYQVNPASATDQEVIMNSYEAMMMHDGVLIVDYPKKKSTAMAY